MKKSFWIGTTVGGIVGAALGLMFAPKAGKELRRDAAGAVRKAGNGMCKAAGNAVGWAGSVKNRWIGVRGGRSTQGTDGEAAG